MHIALASAFDKIDVRASDDATSRYRATVIGQAVTVVILLAIAHSYSKYVYNERNNSVPFTIN